MVEKLNRLKNWQAAAIFIVVGFLIFGIRLKNQFQGDDFTQIVNNTPVHSITNIAQFFSGSTFYVSGAGSSPLVGAYYRPMMTTVFSLIYMFSGAHPFYFHLVQLLLFIGSASLLYVFFKRYFNPLLSFVLALLLLIHPIDSQIVYAIPNMQDALYFFFGLLALYIVTGYRSWTALVVASLCIFISILSKETGALFIPLCLICLYVSEKKRALWFAGTLVVPMSIYVALRIHAIGLLVHPDTAPIDFLGLGGRLLTAPSLLFFYISKLFFPYKLATNYFMAYPSFSVRNVLVPALLDCLAIGIIVYTAILIKHRNKTMFRAYLFFTYWFVSGLLLILQIIPLDSSANEPWFYFSMAGFLGMVGAIIVTFQNRIQPRWFFIVASLIILLCGTRSFIRGADFQSEYTMAQHDIQSNPDDYLAYSVVATYYLKYGDYAKAAPYAAQSVKLFPSMVGYNSLGLTQESAGNYTAAVNSFYAGLNYGAYALLYNNIAHITLVYGNPATDKAFMIQSLQKFPNDSTIWLYLGLLEDRLGDNKDAVIAIKNAAQGSAVSQALYNAVLSGKTFTLQTGAVLQNKEVTI